MILLLVETTVFLLGAVHVARILAKPPLRRDAAAFPVLAATIVVGLLCAAGVAVAVIARWPVVRHVAAVAVAGALGFAWWRARPAYGVSRGRPPGSLGIGRSLDAIDDRTFYRDQARAHGSVFKTGQFGRPVVCVVGLAYGRELLNTNPDALAAATLPYNRRLPRGTLRYMSERDHRDEAPLFRHTFASLALDAGESEIRAACRDALGSIVRASGTGTGVRAREHLADWLFAALTRVFFGLTPEDARVGELSVAMTELRLQRAGGLLWQRRLERALVRVTEVVRAIAREQATSPAVGVGSALRAFLDAAPGALDDPTRARNLLLALRISHGDLTVSPTGCFTC